MNWATLFLIFLIALFAFFFLGQKVAFSLALASLIGFYLIGDTAGLQMVGRAVWKSAVSFELTAVPLFMFMGEIVVRSNLSKRFYNGASTWFARIPGGFLQTNIISCAIFAAISGSSVATAASIGGVSYSELNGRGYDKAMNLGTLGAGGALGILIPPSTSFLIYGAITQTSVAKLFIACIIPGLLMVMIMMAYIVIRVKLNPKLVPELPPKPTGKELWHGLIDMFPFLILMGSILGSIYGGYATPTEAAALSVVLAAVLTVVYHCFRIRDIFDAAVAAAKGSAMVFFIIFGAQLFTTLISKAGISRGLVAWFKELQPTKLVFFLFLCVLYFILGCLMDGTSITYLTVPVLFPMITAIGFDPLWFGVILIVLTEIAMITPPVGMNLFVLVGITKGTATFGDVVRGNLPYVLLYFVLVALLYVFPDLATWLPASM